MNPQLLRVGRSLRSRRIWPPNSARFCFGGQCRVSSSAAPARLRSPSRTGRKTRSWTTRSRKSSSRSTERRPNPRKRVAGGSLGPSATA
eukprot:scaffold477_cov355-Pinguiococcus_pyrenoidosus.AAC.3